MNISYRNTLYFVIILSVLMMIPFLGLTEFNTKGEPREAVVAYTMLEKGNWILPINNGGDIPYKPPFFHWCIALFSLIQGHVSEFTSRLPSSLAVVFMTVGGFVFIAKRKNTEVALLAALLTLTSFEIHRAGYACRVDMLLTALIVGALYLLYRWYDKGKHGMPWMAILCMSAAMLTKGPVGIILPCLVTGIFMLVQKEKFWPTFGRFVLIAVLAMVIPLAWYYAAYQQGGQEFLDLVKEENIDRFTGKMSYASHEEPVWYNFITLIAGWLPWTLLVVISLFALPWKSYSKAGFMASVRKADKLQVFCWLAFLVILFFYCIPKSKRSVYIMPCYPFIAFLMAEYIVWIAKNYLKSIKIYACIIAALAVLLTSLYCVVRCGAVPDTIFHGKHANINIAMLHNLENIELGFLNILLLLLPLAAGVFSVYVIAKKKDSRSFVAAAFIPVIALYIALDGVYQPAVLNAKSDKHLAPVIAKKFDLGKLYSYNAIDMLHFFSMNFYLGDKIQTFDRILPSDGILMISSGDRADFFKEYSRNYDFKPVWTVERLVESRDSVYFYKFTRSSMK